MSSHPAGIGHPTMQTLSVPNCSRPQYPLTPSPTSPFRAHRQHQVPIKSTRPKPYHRPGSEFKPHQLSTGVPSPFSPYTPTSLSSSSSSSVDSHSVYARFSRSQSAFVGGSSTTSSDAFSLQTPQEAFESLAWSQQVLNGALPAPQHQQYFSQRATLPRSDSAPVLIPQPSYPQQSHQALHIPIFGSTSDSQSASSPLVFSTEYIDAQLAKHGSGGAVHHGQNPSQKTDAFNHQTSGLDYQDVLAMLGTGYMFQAGEANAASALPSFPYVPAYVPVPTTTESAAPMETDGVAASKKEPMDEEKKQKYAGDLIEAAIKTLHKIWPETDEPEHVPQPGPVTSDGRLRESTSKVDPPACKVLGRVRRKANQQQFTPDSSPDATKDSLRKRKRTASGSSEQEVDDIAAQASKKRICATDGYAKVAVNIPPAMPAADRKSASTPPAPSTNHITLRLFVRELLRRSKTSCNTLEVALCYLDGIEETVRKLRDCLKLGIAFGTVAMAERGPYDEGMKDEGRIIKLEELQRLETQQQQPEEDDGMDVRGDWNCHEQEWTPMSPASDSESGKPSKTTATKHPKPSSTVLATHPLLDARRTFLASLVLATKFIQDKAYSNKAWAKLSGLGGKEVGRCERALGGALQWRLWVGKDYESGSSIRGKSPAAAPVDESDSLCSGETESVVHGENDPIADALRSQAMERHIVLDAPAPAFAPAQAAAGFDQQLATRAGCGRARTWPTLDVATTPTSSSSSFTPSSTLADQLAAVNLQQAVASGSWPQYFSSTQSTFVACPLTYESPLGGCVEEDTIFEAGGCPTVLTTPATVRMGGENDRTPLMTMDATFGGSQDSQLPPAGFLQAWLTAPTFPFTFNVAQPSRTQSLDSRSMSSSTQRPLLHPQTAALRASGLSTSSTSPHSSSTFSSPEVLTPVHSRASTLVDVLEYSESSWRYGCNLPPGGVAPEFQKCGADSSMYGPKVVQRQHHFQGFQTVL